MDKDTRPFVVRMPELQKKIDDLCKQYDIELVPVINRGLQADSVQVIFVDMKDPEQVKKFGLGKIKNDTPSSLLTN